MSEYPKYTVQHELCGDDAWWEEYNEKELCRGQLVLTYFQFFHQIPLELIAKRGTDVSNHSAASFEAKPLHIDGHRSQQEPLPIAALPNLDGADCFIINRAKKRPCLVLGAIPAREVNPALTRGMANASKAPFFLVAPFYGVKKIGRSGYNAEFVESVKHAVYPQFFWDDLPGEKGEESILRIDQIQPVGLHDNPFSSLGYRLSEDALYIFDEWLNCVLYGEQKDSLIADFRSRIQNL